MTSIIRFVITTSTLMQISSYLFVFCLMAGGPSMLRSTAKNHAFTCIVTSPDQYKSIQEEIEAKGGT